MAQNNWLDEGSTPVPQPTSAAADTSWLDEQSDISQDNALVRGFKKSSQSIGITKGLLTGDSADTARKVAEAADYARKNPGTKEGAELMDAWNRGDGVTGGVTEVAGEFAKDWRSAKGFIPGVRATAKNLQAMGSGIVEQVPNMIAPVAGMIAGGAAGSAAAGPVGTVLGGWAGASLGNTAVEGGSMVQEALQKDKIDPTDQAAVSAYLDKNGDRILGQAGVKGAIIGAVDTATAGLGHFLLSGPGKAAASRALADMGVDAADKAAVRAAQSSAEFKNRIASDAVYQATQQGSNKIARNAGAAALEPAGEFAGEFVGQGVATGEWDAKNAALEAASSIGQSGAMYAGQKAIQAFSRPGAATNDPSARPAPAQDEFTTAPGAADPSAPVPPGAAPVEAPDLQATAPATEEAPSPIQPEAVEPAPLTPEQRMAELDERMRFIDQQAKANGWDKRLIDARDETRAELDALRGSAPTEPPAFDAPGIDPIRQMVKQAADAGGALSAAAGVALDLGVTNAQFLGATGRDMQVRRTGPGVADESNVIDVQGRVVEDRAIGTPRRLTNPQDGMAARALGGDIAAQPPANRGSVPALPAPTNLRDAIARIRAQKQGAANAQATAPEAAPATQSVPAAGTGAVEAVGMKPAGQRQLSADEQAAQDREEARAKEPSLPPALSARLQEAHKAHGRDVKRSVVERSIANEKANNTGTPKAKRERADRIARLEADLALFDEAAAMPPKEAAGLNRPKSARKAAEFDARKAAEIEAGALGVQEAEAAGVPTQFTWPAHRKWVYSQAPRMTLREFQEALKGRHGMSGPDIEAYYKSNNGGAEVSAAKITTEGAANAPQAAQAQQGSTQSTQAGGPQAGAAAATASTVPAGGNRVQAAGLTNGAPTQNPGAQAAPAAGAQGQAQGSEVEALRKQLRDVEDRILAAAPSAMAQGGGDIEAAMKSRKVPVTLKAQRKKLKEQLQQSQDLQRNQPQALAQQAQAATEQQAAPGRQSTESTYTLPSGSIGDEWLDDQKRSPKHPDFTPTPRQQLLMDAVAKALDDGAFYKDDVTDKVAQALGVSGEVLASNRTGVQGGDFGYDVYNARNAVEAQRGNAKSREFAKSLNLKPGDTLGTLVFQDGKVTTGVKVVSINESGLIVTITGKRGSATLDGEVGVDNLAAALDRAREKGKRKDSYEEFIASRSANLQEGIAAAQDKAQQAQAATESVAQSDSEEDDRLPVGWKKSGAFYEFRNAAGSKFTPSQVAAVIGRKAVRNGMHWVTDVPYHQWEQAKAKLQAAGMWGDSQQSSAAPAQETTHNGTRIYPAKTKVGDEVKSMWAVESPDNQRRRAAGERTIGGDSLHDTIEQAKAAAEREAKRDAEQQAAKAEQDAADKARRDAEEARKAANRPKSVVERRKDAILDGPSKIGQGTKRAVIATAVDSGYAIEAKMVYDHAAKKRDQEAVDRASRAGYILGVSNENLPLVKAGNEAKARLKEGKYEKPEYRVYQGSDTKAPFREITKTEYDYAQELKAQRAAAPQAEAAQSTTTQQDSNDFLPEGWTKSVNGFTKRPVYRMEQGVGQPFAVVTQTDGMTYEVQIRHGDKQLTVSNQTGALSEVLAKAETELTRMTQADSVTHQDPGEKAEAATPGVVTDSLKKAARNEDTKPSEMRKWLVGKIDEAIAVAPEAAVDFLSFDVPGDGTFKVQNSQARLQEFRKNVMASPGFKDGGQKQAKPQQNDSILNSGGTAETIRAFLVDGDVQGAVEFAKLKGVEFTPVPPQMKMSADGKGKVKHIPASVKSSVPSVAEGLTQVEAEQINQYLTAEQARAEPADAQDAAAQQAPTATETVAQPITRADVAAAQQQAATLIAERIDAMTAGEVNTIARRFLPTMGVKPTISKERNKAAVTDFTKVNPLAAAAEFGVTLPADVRRALEAEMQGKVVDAGQDDGLAKAQPAVTYINGDRAEYTGNTETISGGLFYEVRFTEGAKNGKTAVTQRAPDGANPAQSGPTAPTGIVTPQLSSNPEQFIKIAADSIKSLRKVDVDRVLNETPAAYRQEVASYIRDKRKDLADEVDDVMADIQPKAAAAKPAAAPQPAAPASPQDGIAQAQANAARFAIGKSLTKEQRKQVLGSLVDVYKAKGAEREFKGQDSNGNDRYGYAHSPDLFEKSDITGAMVRYYVTLPDGRIAHPTELFPYVSASDVERMALEQDAKRRRLEAFENAIKPFYQDFDSANLMAVAGQVVISKGDRFAIIPNRIGAVNHARQQGWELAKAAAPAEPNPLEHTPKQYADAWLRWVAESNGTPLAEVREMQGDEAGLKAIEQRWADAVVQEAKSGQPLPTKTLDKLLEVRPNTQLPESAIPDGYQRPEARKQEADEQQARADNRKKVETKDDDTGNAVKFSRAPATDVRNLVTLHNLTEDNLRYADSLGGIPVPSIGITKVDSPFGGFGNITLIAPKDMIDPKSGVPVYDRDAWTARFPTMNFKKVKAKLADAFYDRVKPVREMMAGDDGGFVSALWEQVRNASVQSPEKVIDIFTRYEAGRVLYAKEVLGKSIKVPTKAVAPKEFFAHEKPWLDFVKSADWSLANLANDNPEYIALRKEAGAAAMAAVNAYVDRKIEAAAGSSQYERETTREIYADMAAKFVEDNGAMRFGVMESARIDAGNASKKQVDRAKLFDVVQKAVKPDDPGYLRWVESLVKPLFEAPTITLRGKEVPATLDNIVDAMTVGATAGVEKSMTFSAGKAAAMLGKRFKSMDEIKAARDQVVSPQAEAEGKKSSDALLAEYRSHVSQFYTGKDWRGNIDTWAANDDAMEALAKAGKAASSDANIRAALTRMGFKGVDQQALDMARDAIDALRNAATDYFEAKPQRAVKLNEFKGAVVPKGTNPEAIAILEKHGIAVELYGKTEGAREKAIQKLAKRLDKESGGVLFSFAGARAATADTHALVTAQDRLDAGEDPETVRRETGWHRGPDGRMRFEISDNEAKVNMDLLANLHRGGFAARSIEHVSYRQEPDGTYSLTLAPKSPQKTSDFVNMRGIPENLLPSLLPQSALDAIEQNHGEEDMIGPNFDDARRVRAPFQFRGFNALPLDLVMDHPKLFAAYPALREIMVQVDAKLGNGATFAVTDYADGTVRNVISIGNPLAKDVDSALLHEIQHGIQDIEGFATGGNLAVGLLNHEIHALLRKQRDDFESGFGYPDWEFGLIAGRPDVHQKLMKEGAAQGHSLRPVYQAFANEMLSAGDGDYFVSRMLRYDSEIRATSVAARMTPHEYYTRLAGEVEARNTQSRQKLTAEQRRATSPGSTADVADADVIVVFNGKEMANAPMPANAVPDAATTTQPLRTPAATIRAAITKAYGKLLVQLESKGLVTLTQTEDEAIEAAAQARAAKTGQPVERERARLQLSIRGEADELSMSIYSDEAGKIERALEAMGLQVSTEVSRISQSTYVIVESPEYTQTEGESGSVLKIRVSDHRLPGGYQQPDFEVQVGNAHQGVDMADAAGAWFDAVSWVGRRFGVEPKGAAKRQIAAAAEKKAKAKQSAVAVADQQRDRLDASKARLQAWLQSLPDGALWGNARRGGWVAVLDGKMIGRFDGETATGEGQPWYGGPYPVEAQKNLQPVRESLRASVKNSVADQTQTENFQRWFKDSKVVDADGKPLVVYHGTDAGFTEFKTRKQGSNTGAKDARMGFWFSSDAEHAGNFNASNVANRILPVYLGLKNPLVVDHSTLDASVAHPRGEKYESSLRTDAISKAKKAGHDGVIFKNTFDSYAARSDMSGAYRVDLYVAFHPEQIKSAIGNRGTFDPADPDIRRSADGAIQGFFDPQTGQSFMIADNLTAEAAPGVLMHEVGIHMAADGSMKALFNRAAMMLKMQRGNPFMKAVQARMDAAGETSGEEAAAYIAEAYENDRANAPASVQRWLSDLLAAVKAWMFKKGIMGADRLTMADIAAVARANARSMARDGGATGGQGFGTAFSRTPGDQTQTEAFKRWFKDSKVVDADGTPLRVFHGTTSDIRAFAGKAGAEGNGAFFFTESPEAASAYAKKDRARLDEVYRLEEQASEVRRQIDVLEDAGRSYPDPEIVALEREWDSLSSKARELEAAPEGAGSNVIPAYLSIQNPLVIDMGRSGKGQFDLASIEKIGNAIERAKADGRDGVIVRNTHDSPEEGEAHDIFVAFRSEQVKSAIGNNGNFDPTNPDIRFSRTTEAAKAVGDAIKSVTVTNIKQRAGFKLTDYLGIGLQALGRRQIVDIYGDMLPLAEYNRLVQQMEADKNEGGAEADKLVTRWAKLDDEGKLADLMHDATLAQIDPAKPYVDGDDKARYMMLQGRFNALTDAAKQVYTDTRDSYQAHHAKVRSAIKERIERSEIKGERKAALLKQMDDEFFKAIKGVYFPLARFGQYAVTVKGPDGKVESVSRAETKAEAEALRNNLLAAFPRDKGFTVGRVMLSKDFIADRDAVGRGFMTELYQVLDKQDMDAAQRAELEDTLGQLYLSSLPDLSWAKHGIHRKGTPGFSQDARRAYAQNMFHGSRYLAKLRYSDLMQDELTAMQKHVDDWREVEDFDQNSAQRVVDEMNKRHESLMNPKSNPLSTALTSLGFVFHLGLSPASAMVNLSQTAMVAYPIMGAKWGFGKASAALLKASAEAAKGKNDITGSLNADELAAYNEAVRAGTIDVTMAHDLAGIAQGEDAGVMWKIRPVMRWASFLFHHAERFNRQVTFVAAYRLAREAGADQKAAYEQATKATYDGHFDYGAANRPRIMQGNVAKVLLLFKQYGQNMVYTLARNAQQAIKGESPEVRAQARKALGGLLATHAAAAGVLGLPMVTTLLAAASMIGGDDDEPWDAKVALQNMLADTLGQKPAEVLAHGLSRLTPWDISGRVGLDKLIFPDVQEGLEGQRLAESAMTAALGPVAGIGVNLLKGMQMIGEGRYAMGLEAMMPAALRGPVKALRYAEEGVQDKSGISILDEVSPAAVAGQALGFSPSAARNAQEGKSAILAHDRALNERRQELLTKISRATMAKDEETKAEAREEIRRFNEKNPTRRITPLNVLQSVRNRQKRIDQADGGVYLPKNRRDAMEAGRFAMSE